MRNLVFWSTLCCWTLGFAEKPASNTPFRYPAYIGVAGGYGSTTWQGLVPSASNQNLALSISTPTWVDEGGFTWGMLAGYEFSPYFAIEASYAHYPDATIVFDSTSLFAFENDGKTELVTHTDTVSLMAKLMLIIPHTQIRAYSSAGAARVLRTDDVNRNWRISPTFGVGLNYEITAHLMGELGANYTAGYGESELNPANDYVPFLYSVQLKLAYRF